MAVLVVMAGGSEVKVVESSAEGVMRRKRVKKNTGVDMRRDQSTHVMRGG